MNYLFGTFTFTSASLELTRDGRRVALEPQPARALAVLLARAGQVVTREEMRQAIWGEATHVDYDRGLAYGIGQVRAALGDNAETPRFVQTLPKRGFRFIAPVSREAPAGAHDTPSITSAAPTAPSADVAPPPSRTSARRWLALAAVVAVVVGAIGMWWAARPPARSIVAVSIFDNETGDPSHDAFVTGLSDVVVTELTALAPGRVGVVGNAAPLRQPRNIRNLKALAASIDADFVVIGQLQRQDGDLRFILHFIQLGDGVHLSAQRFVRPVTEVAAFERDVLTEARRVVQRYILDSGSPSSSAATR